MHSEASISYGTGVELINEYDIKHKCNTDYGSSGGPILNYSTNKVIGIHKGSVKKDDGKNIDFNIGTFLKFPLNELKILNQNNNNKNQ
jgi:V8-like Glu-specific endopeptidase